MLVPLLIGTAVLSALVAGLALALAALLVAASRQRSRAERSVARLAEVEARVEAAAAATHAARAAFAESGPAETADPARLGTADDDGDAAPTDRRPRRRTRRPGPTVSPDRP